MSNSTHLPMSRRYFCKAGGYTLLAAFGYGLTGCAQDEESSSQHIDLFQAAFKTYGYEQYLSEITENARRGGVQAKGVVPVASGGGKCLQDFRRAWGLEEIFTVDWKTLSSQPVGNPAESSSLTRVRFDLSCGFPVIALIGAAQGQAKGVVLLMHGIGTTPEQSMGLGQVDYMRHVGRRLMAQGYNVVCPFIPQVGNFKSIAKLALLLAAHGVSYHGLMVSIALASLDVAIKQKSTAVGRVFCYGVSIGALIGLHVSLLDERVNALVLSGYLRDDKTLLQQGVHERMTESGEIYPTWFTPSTWRYGLEETIDIYVPRPLFIEVGTGDSMSGVDQGRDLVLHSIQAAYQAAGRAMNFGNDIFHGAHEANGVEAINWLGRFDA